MKPDSQQTHIVITREPANPGEPPLDPADSYAKVCEWAEAATTGSPAYLISQAFEKIRFENWTGQLPNGDFAGTFSGRIFGPEAEVRWVREGSGFRLWKIEESSPGIACHKWGWRYYLWGYWKNDRFAEERIPVEPKYPLPHSCHPKDMDRAYIQVAEYAPVEPENWPGEIGKIEDNLNQPALLAHRFVSLGCGRNEK